jgi:predicted RNA-binding protein with PUA-like domain
MPSSAQRARQYWLMKSEPDEASIDDLAREGTLPWTGVRNYQARNFMRDQMRIGDGVLFYHSSCPEPASPAWPRSAPALPRFHAVRSEERLLRQRVEAGQSALVARRRELRPQEHADPLQALREHDALADMVVLRRGNRLSITPVTPAEWRYITEKLMK